METKKTIVFRDPAFEDETRAQLAQARKDVQSLLNVWLRLDIGACDDIFELLVQPQAAYKKRIDVLTVVPDTGGRFKVRKELHLNTLELPDPGQLYEKAGKIRQKPHCANRELWSIEGDQVKMNNEIAEDLINSQNVYASDASKIQLAEDLARLCDLMNNLNKRLHGEILPETPWTFNFFRGKFKLGQQSYGGLQSVSIDPDWLKSIVNNR